MTNSKISRLLKYPSLMAHGDGVCEYECGITLRRFILGLILVAAIWVPSFTTVASAAHGVPSQSPSCTSAQLWSYRSIAIIANRSISEHLYFKNLGTRCDIVQGEVSVQLVTGTGHSPIGLSTTNDFVPYPPVILNSGQIVTASFTVRLLAGNAIATCGRNSVMGILVQRPVAIPHKKYFKLPAVHVCTNNFVSIFGSLFNVVK
jgi:hypothetical protein